MVASKTWPMPPVASTTALAWTAPTPSRAPSPMTCSVTPAAPPCSSLSRSSTSAWSMTSISPMVCSRAAISAREISLPVASPPACAMRSARWPPSRPSAMAPSAVLSNSAPRAISRRTAAGPSVTRTRTASSSQTPAPATSVSRRCASGLSPTPSAAAMPPCAQRVEPSCRRAFVTSSTLPACRAASAAVMPATPEPTTTVSAYARHPGWGALSRWTMSVHPSHVPVAPVPRQFAVTSPRLSTCEPGTGSAGSAPEGDDPVLGVDVHHLRLKTYAPRRRPPACRRSG